MAAAFLDRIRRPASASTVATNWSQHTSVSIGHNVPHRHIPVIKGDVNFINTNNMLELDDNDAVPSYYIKEILDQLSQSPIDSIDHEDALEFLYDLFYMHPLYNQDDSRIARLFIENNYCSIVHHCLIEFMNNGIFSNTSIRRSTQFILYTLWNFTGINIEFRLYLSNNEKFLKYLIEIFFDYLKTFQHEKYPVPIIENLMQSIISIIHNITLNNHHLNIDEIFQRFNQLLFEQEVTKTNERYRLTLFLCLINLKPKYIYQNQENYQILFKLLFHFLKKIVQQEILMIKTGLSAWLLANSINKLPIDIVLQDDNRLYSFMILFKRGMREEKLQAGLILNRSIQKSNHAKDLIEKDQTCWNLLQQYQIFLDDDEQKKIQH